MSGSLAFVNVFGRAARPSHRMTVQFEAMGVVDQAVEDRISDGRIADLRMPTGHRQLAGQQHGAGLIARIADLEEVAALGFGHGSHRPVVDNEQVDAAESIEDFRVAAVGARGGEMAKQLGGFEEQRV